MVKISLAGFKDPVRRPRYIIWIGVVVLLLAAVVLLALGVTSTRWFCADACHKVQDDTVIAYQHSSHNQISCIACHMPVNADPITFVLHKMKALGELYLTITNKFELPMNAASEVALGEEMKSTQCTQCHSSNRVITPSPGIIINHKVHEEKEYQCTVCHNRVAHKEDFRPTLPGNRKHQNFMTMTACFRCHSQAKDAKAPGDCIKCHPKDFELKPESHLTTGFFPAGHAELAKLALEVVDEGNKEAAKLKAEGGGAEGEGQPLPLVPQVNYCNTCHAESFCFKCHGMEIPHPAEFKEPTGPKDPKGHPAISKTKFGASKCEMCHHPSKTQFCNKCHHGTYVKWAYKPAIPWVTQHATAVQQVGVKTCLGKCHNAKFCSDCHTARKPVPSSHDSSRWLHGTPPPVSDGGQVGTAKTVAGHSTTALKQPDDCAVCHGGDGTAKTPFCKACHKAEMPHPQQFKQFHSKTGRQSPAVCRNCHTWPELCSNCHHKGAVNNVSWTTQHAKTVRSSGTANCFEKCHKQDFCVACHTRNRVLPSSHKASNWTRDFSAKKAGHTTSYNKAPDDCALCHGTGGTKSKFCMNCHKIAMPHPETFGPPAGATPTKDNGGDHAAAFRTKKLNRAICGNCHPPSFCDGCHHKPDYKPGSPWGVARIGVAQQHPGVVRKKGVEGCFACHPEVYCSRCHVSATR